MIYTFYSFKGGVGRSMALANVAKMLYLRGKRVIMIDWDLEAPGLETYFFPTSTEREKVLSQPGLIDVLESYKSSVAAKANFTNQAVYLESISKTLVDVQKEEFRPAILRNLVSRHDHFFSGTAEELGNEIESTFKNGTEESELRSGLMQILQKRLISDDKEVLQNYLETNLPSITPLLQSIYQNRTGDGSRGPGLWLLSAGMRNDTNFAEYSRLVQNFDWSEFYSSYNGEAYFEWFHKELSSFADYILIDSRTGVTEMGGVCTRQLADVVVLVTAPNFQNLSGMKEMAKSIQRQDVVKARKRQLKNIIIVPSRLDNTELPARNKFEANFRRTVEELTNSKTTGEEYWNLAIPYVPRYAYTDELVVGASAQSIEELEKSSLSKELEAAYSRITDYLLNGKTTETNFLYREPDVSPYVGQTPYTMQHAHLFFGRSYDCNRVLERIAAEDIVVLAGRPGSGKTSLIQAGIAPVLKKGGMRVLNLQRGAQQAILTLSDAGAVNSSVMSDDLQKKLQSDSNLDLTEVFEVVQRDKREKFCLIIDQTEELFNPAIRRENITGFLKALYVLSDKHRVKLLFSIRSEYVGQFLDKFGDSGKIKISPPIYLGELTKEDILNIITGPAKGTGLQFEAGLVERIANDCSDLNLPPFLLQLMLHTLWTNRSGNSITHIAYDRIGKVEGIFRTHIDKAINSIPEKDLYQARKILSRMFDPVTKRKVSIQLFKGEEDEQSIASIQTLVNAGLVKITDNGTDRVVAEFSHDFIIANLKVLEAWLVEDGPYTDWRRRMNLKLEEWKQSGMRHEYLLTKTALKEALEWKEQRENSFTREELEYVAISKKQSLFSNLKQTAGQVFGVALISTSVYFGATFNSSQGRDEADDQFRARLTMLNTYADEARKDSTCALSNFNNISGNKGIELTKDSLLRKCLELEALYAVTAETINTSSDRLDSLQTKASSDFKVKQHLDQIDKLELEINNLKQNPVRDFKVQMKLENDSSKLAILKSAPVIREATGYSNQIHEAIRTKEHATNADTRKEDVLWFKRGYYLTFSDVKVQLMRLSQSEQTITVNICRTDDLTCRQILQNLVLKTGEEQVFDLDRKSYAIRLVRIGRAGNNPFTPAAFISFKKIDREVVTAN
jgi:MinD-like ATPase involved in chromosome partitioning or flagellar assembly